MFFDLRERETERDGGREGRGRERERKIDVREIAIGCLQYVPNELNLQLFGVWDASSASGATRPGLVQFVIHVGFKVLIDL